MSFEVSDFPDRPEGPTDVGPLPDMTVSEPYETRHRVAEPAVVPPADIPGEDVVAQTDAHDPSPEAAITAVDGDFPHQGAGDVGHVVLDSGVEASEERTKPAYADLEAKVAEMEERLTAEGEALEQAEESVSDAERQAIDAVSQRYVAARREAEQRGDKVPSYAAMLASAEGVPENFKERMSAFEATEAALDVAEEELEAYFPEKLADVTRLVTELEKSLDYDKVVEDAFVGNQKSALYEVSSLIRAQGLLDAEEPPSYRELRSIGNNVSKYGEKWQQSGLITEVDHMPASEPMEVFTAEQLETKKAQIQGALDFLDKYKRQHSSLRGKAQPVLDVIGEMEKFEPLPANLNELYVRNGLVYNDGLGSALQRRLEQELAGLPREEFEPDVHSETYTQFVERARAIDPIAALEKLEVKGTFENLPFDFSEDELKTFLANTIPPIALDSVKRISFRPMGPEEALTDTAAGVHKWSNELGGTEIVISDEKINELYQMQLEELSGNNELSQEQLQYSIKNVMLEVVAHEFAHRLHEVLPYAALLRWEAWRSSDPTNITDYVKDRHDADLSTRYMEDFCDSLAQFCVMPYALTLTSSTRYIAMQQIYVEYMPHFADTLNQRQIQLIDLDREQRLAKGISDEEARRNYLAHEYDEV